MPEPLVARLSMWSDESPVCCEGVIVTTHIHYPHFHLPALVRRHMVLFAMLVVVLVIGIVAGIWLGQRSTPASESAPANWAPEYGVDTPLVTYTNLGASLWVGADANLDPDVAAWGQSEYLVDTPLVTYTNLGASLWVGADANLDPDVAAWGQSEYDVDTPLVIYADRGASYWIGGDANLDPDE
jgi:hypothetical protein